MPETYSSLLVDVAKTACGEHIADRVRWFGNKLAGLALFVTILPSGVVMAQSGVEAGARAGDGQLLPSTALPAHCL